MPFGDERIIIASAGGAPNNPAWYHNITAKPDRVTLRIGTMNHTARSRVLEGDERERAWQQLTASFPNYENYRQKTTREMPVIALST